MIWLKILVVFRILSKTRETLLVMGAHIISFWASVCREQGFFAETHRSVAYRQTYILAAAAYS